jgi:hypothetical protein
MQLPRKTQPARSRNLRLLLHHQKLLLSNIADNPKNKVKSRIIGSTMEVNYHG